MKRLVVLFLIIGTSLIFFMCSTDDPTAPKVKQAPDPRPTPRRAQPEPSDEMPEPLAAFGMFGRRGLVETREDIGIQRS